MLATMMYHVKQRKTMIFEHCKQNMFQNMVEKQKDPCGPLIRVEKQSQHALYNKMENVVTCKKHVVFTRNKNRQH